VKIQIYFHDFLNLYLVLAPMPEIYKMRRVKPRGVSNRNRGLEWLRENARLGDGVLYFADDDNTYDIALFDEIRSTEKVIALYNFCISQALIPSS